MAVASTGSFAAASEQLSLTQPALSMSVKKLEETLGGELFWRSTRRVSLTPEGEALYKRAGRLLTDWQQSFDDVADLFTLQRGSLAIAAMPTFASGELPPLIKQFMQRYPQINLSVQDVIAEQVVAALHDGRVELGVSFEPTRLNGLNFTPLLDDTFVVAMPKGHVLSTAASVEWSQLLSYPHIALHRPSSVRLLTDKMLGAHNLALSPQVEAHQLSSIGPMVAANVGLSAVPALSAKQFDSAQVITRPLTQPTITRRIGLLHKTDVPLSTAAQQMKSIIIEAFRGKKANA